jgi:chromosome segregation ATPase
LLIVSKLLSIADKSFSAFFSYLAASFSYFLASFLQGLILLPVCLLLVNAVGELAKVKVLLESIKYESTAVQTAAYTSATTQEDGRIAAVTAAIEKHEQVVDITIAQVLSLQQQLRGKIVDVGCLTQELKDVKGECTRTASEKDAMIASRHERVAQLEKTLASMEEAHEETKDELTETKYELTLAKDELTGTNDELTKTRDELTLTKDERNHH